MNPPVDRTPAGPPARGRPAIAASFLAVVLIAGYMVASPDTGAGMSAAFVVNAVVLVLVFWFPAMRIGSPGDLVRHWKTLLPWLLAWTLVWDLASSGITGGRDLFAEWWLVYPSGVMTLLLLLLLHGFVVRRVGA